ncbi:MAG: hypothetical protein J7L42_00775, partial [Elusimicrobia bacterium]|nr:hypothetical protein [Elusimicrobiota bacterium]
RQGRSREMARSPSAADLLQNSSLPEPCLPETTRNVAADPWSAIKVKSEKLKMTDEAKYYFLITHYLSVRGHAIINKYIYILTGVKINCKFVI